jgi:hypothetical protein
MKKGKSIGKIFGVVVACLVIGTVLPFGTFGSENQVLAQAPKIWHVDDDGADYPGADFTPIIWNISDAASDLDVSGQSALGCHNETVVDSYSLDSNGTIGLSAIEKNNISDQSILSVSGDTVVVRLELLDIPSTLTFQQDFVPDNSLEYEWCIAIDVDNDPNTGEWVATVEGCDVEISLTSWKWPDSEPYDTTIYEGTQHNTWVYDGDSWKWGHEIDVTVDYASNTITMVASKAWEELSNLDENSRFCFRTECCIPETTWADLTSFSQGSAVIDDPMGDVPYDFIDIIQGSLSVETTSGGPDLAVDIISTDSFVIGERASVTIKIENKGNASIPAKRHTINVCLIDYPHKQPLSFRAGDSYWTVVGGENSRCVYSAKIDLPELRPGDLQTKQLEFLTPELSFGYDNPGIWADTVKASIWQEWPDLYEDVNRLNNVDEENIVVSPSADTAISCALFYALPIMIDYFGVVEGIELNGNIGTAFDVYLFAKHVRQGRLDQAANDLVSIVIAVAHKVLKDPITFVASLAKGLWEGVVSCTNLWYLAVQFTAGCIQAGINIVSNWVRCPVDILIVDEQGNRAGYLDGTIYKEIEGAEVVVVDDQKLVLIPWQSNYTVVLRGTDVGTMDFQMILPGGENTAKIVEYQDVSISQATGATVDVSPENPEYLMMIDNNGDGQVDEERHPNLINTLPYTPTNCSPADHSINVPIDPDLSWTGGDSDAGDTVIYNVYFGTSEAPPLVSNNQSGTTYDPGTLAYNTTYYWQIVATDDHGASTTGPLWGFTTAEAMPSGSWCFIATAAYGTPMAEEIQILREFRDEYLLTNPLGQALVGLYYKLSPPIAEFITEHPSLKPIVRAGLLPAVVMSIVVINTTSAEKAAIVSLIVLVSVAVAIWVTRRRGRGPEYR